MASVGLLTLEIYIPGLGSLKEKRGTIKPILARIRHDFNVSAAEIEDMDQPGTHGDRRGRGVRRARITSMGSCSA